MVGPRSLPLALVLAAAVGCSGKDALNPGTKLGTFHVSAKLTQTTCGQVPDPWEFDVRLNHEGSTLYWIQGGVPIQGQVDSRASTRLEAEIVQEVRAADAKSKIPACTVARTDVLTVTLADANAQPSPDPGQMERFTGALVYTFAPTEGSECADQLTTGAFAALPCQVSYDLTGDKR